MFLRLRGATVLRMNDCHREFPNGLPNKKANLVRWFFQASDSNIRCGSHHYQQFGRLPVARRIDAHAHVFARNSAEFPRQVSEQLPADREEPVEKLLASMEANDVEQAVLVQTAGTAFEHHAYLRHEEGPEFAPTPSLGDDDVQQIVQTSARRIIRLCVKRGLLGDAQADPLADEEPLLAAITAASVNGVIATGERAGHRLRRVLQRPG